MLQTCSFDFFKCQNLIKIERKCKASFQYFNLTFFFTNFVLFLIIKTLTFAGLYALLLYLGVWAFILLLLPFTLFYLENMCMLFPFVCMLLLLPQIVIKTRQGLLDVQGWLFEIRVARISFIINPPIHNGQKIYSVVFGSSSCYQLPTKGLSSLMFPVRM